MGPFDLSRITFSDHEMRQLQHIKSILNQTVCSTLEELHKIMCSGLSSSRSGKSGEHLNILTARIRHHVQSREQLIRHAAERKPDSIIVHFGSLCDNCYPLGIVDGGDTANMPASLLPDHVRAKELRAAIWLTERIESRLLKRENISTALSMSLRRLKNAFQRLETQLQNIVPELQTSIKVVKEFDSCGSCGKLLTWDDRADAPQG